MPKLHSSQTLTVELLRLFTVESWAEVFWWRCTADSTEPGPLLQAMAGLILLRFIGDDIKYWLTGSAGHHRPRDSPDVRPRFA